MHFTKVQISELMRKHAEKENGLHVLHENPQNKGNGYRFGHAYGQGRKLEFRTLWQLSSPDTCHSSQSGRGM